MADQNDQRLEEALRNASDAGDTEAATQIAQEIRSRRARGDQQDIALDTDAVSDDPLANVPTSIGGVQVSDEIRQAILLGRSMEDPKKQRLLAARIAGRMVAESDVGGLGGDFNRSQFGTALRSLGTGIFGLGDVAAAAGTVVGSGFKLSFGEALEAQREFRRAQEEKFPITAGISEVAGAFLGGTAILKVAKEVATGTRAADILSKVTTFKKGQKLANIGRASLLAGTGGAITEGVTEGEPGRGAITGFVAGPFGIALAKVLGVTVPVFKAGIERAQGITKTRVDAFLNDPSAKGLKVLANKLGVDSKEMSRRFLEFKAVTGKNPSIADITNPQAATELREVIAASASASQIAREGAERTLGIRTQEIAEQVTGGKFTTSVESLEKTAKAIAKKRFAAAKKDNITFSPGEVQDVLLDRNMKILLKSSPNTQFALGELIEEAGEGGAVTLKGELADNIRRALVEARKVNPTNEANVLLRSFDDILRAESKNFDEAIGGLERRLIGTEGFAVGEKVTKVKLSESALEAQLLTVAEKGAPGRAFAGARTGARSKLGTAALEGANASANLAKTLSENSGLIQRLRTILPAREVDKLQNIGRIQSRSIANIGKIAPSAKVNTELQEAVSDAVNATVLVSTSTSSASKVFAFGRLLKGMGTGLNDRIIKNIARDAFDPKKTQKVISALRRAELNEEAILDLYAQSALSAGIVAAERTGE